MLLGSHPKRIGRQEAAYTKAELRAFFAFFAYCDGETARARTLGRKG
jgi:hypothetical protein